MFSTRHIDCFLAVAQSLSFSGAAEELYLSQSTVSQQVAGLEKELGFVLFERDRHKVVLTEAGEYLASELRMVKTRSDAAIEQARSIARLNARSFRLGYDGPLGEPWVADAIKTFHKSRPEVSLRLRKEPLVRLAALLESGGLDAALISDAEALALEGKHFRAFSEGSACVYYPQGHRFAQLESITPQDLVGEHLITSYDLPDAQGPSRTATQLLAAGIDLSGADYIPDGDTAFLAVQTGMGVFVASHLCDRFAERYGVGSVDLDAGLAPAKLVLAWTHDCPEVDLLTRCIARTIENKYA